MATVNNNIWEIVEKHKAADYAKAVLPVPFESKVLETKMLTKACREMNSSFDEIIDEQNEYLIEIENINDEIKALQEDLNAKIKNKEEEIQTLLANPEGETLSDEEREEIEALYDDIDVLNAEINGSIEVKNAEIKTNSQKVSNINTKETIAQDYGDRTLDLGTQLAGTEVKGGFFRKLFGRTKKLRNKKATGEVAIKVANELLSKVEDSREVSTKIAKKSKLSK